MPVPGADADGSGGFIDKSEKGDLRICRGDMPLMKWGKSEIDRDWGVAFQRHMLKFFLFPFADFGSAEIGAIELRIQQGWTESMISPNTTCSALWATEACHRRRRR